MSETPPVDLPAVARARDELGEAVQRWPHLTEPSAQERLAAHLDDEREAMARKKTEKAEEKIQTAIRLDVAIVERLDAIGVKLSRPGLVVTRSDAMRIALLTGIEAIEKEK